MRKLALLASLLAAPAFGQTGDGPATLTGLETVAREVCNHRQPTADPAGLATALEGALGDAMGLLNQDSIIGVIHEGDPEQGGSIWASTIAGRSGGCDQLIRTLSVPAATTLAEIN